MLTKQDAKNLADKILSYSKLPGCSVNINASETVFIRFANNGITTSGYSLDQTVSIESTTEDKRSGSANVSEWSDDALKNGVELAERLARISQPDPEYMPALGPQQYPELPNFDSATGNSRGDALIGHVKAVIDGARGAKLTTAGFIQRSANWVAVANKSGLFGYHQYTDSTLSNTMRNAGGTSSIGLAHVARARHPRPRMVAPGVDAQDGQQHHRFQAPPARPGDREVDRQGQRRHPVGPQQRTRGD